MEIRLVSGQINGVEVLPWRKWEMGSWSISRWNWGDCGIQGLVVELISTGLREMVTLIAQSFPIAGIVDSVVCGRRVQLPYVVDQFPIASFPDTILYSTSIGYKCFM